MRDKEQQVQALREAHADPAAPSDELLNCNAELSHLYVQAIRSKLDLFESLTGGA